jgi:hypothetical protein
MKYTILGMLLGASAVSSQIYAKEVPAVRKEYQTAQEIIKMVGVSDSWSGIDNLVKDLKKRELTQPDISLLESIAATSIKKVKDHPDSSMPNSEFILNVVRSVAAVDVLANIRAPEAVPLIDKCFSADSLGNFNYRKLFSILEPYILDGNRQALDILLHYAPIRDIGLKLGRNFYAVIKLYGNEKVPTEWKDEILQRFMDMYDKHEADWINDTAIYYSDWSERIPQTERETMLKRIVKGLIDPKVEETFYIVADRCIIKSEEPKGLAKDEKALYTLVKKTGFEDWGYVLDTSSINSAKNDTYQKTALKKFEENRQIIQDHLWLFSKHPQVFFYMFMPDDGGQTEAAGIAHDFIHQYALIKTLEEFPSLKNTVKQSPLYKPMSREVLRKKEMERAQWLGTKGTDMERALYRQLFKK